jgi:hypothetical protein
MKPSSAIMTVSAKASKLTVVSQLSGKIVICSDPSECIRKATCPSTTLV